MESDEGRGWGEGTECVVVERFGAHPSFLLPFTQERPPRSPEPKDPIIRKKNEGRKKIKKMTGVLFI